jgi:hypothetical protein
MDDGCLAHCGCGVAVVWMNVTAWRGRARMAPLGQGFGLICVQRQISSSP